MSGTWYIPPGITPPAHLPTGIDRVNLAPTAGPKGLAPGGTMVGGICDPAQPFLSAEGEGWGFTATTPRLDSLLRQQRPPCVRRQLSAYELELPLLFGLTLAPHPELVHRLPRMTRQGLVVDTIVENQAEIDAVEPFLRTVLNGDEPNIDDAGLWDLAIRLLCLVYHLSPHEVAGWQLLQDHDPLVVVLGCADLELQ